VYAGDGVIAFAAAVVAAILFVAAYRLPRR